MNIGKIFERIAVAGSRGISSMMGGGGARATSAGAARAAAAAAGSTAESTASKIFKYSVGAGGLIGTGMCLYDAHKEGQRWQEIIVKKKNNLAAQYWFDNTRNLHNTSNINAKLKDKLFDWETKSNLRAYMNTGVGYSRGFFGMLASDIVPLAISVSAALAPLSKGAGKYISGGALGLYALYGFTKNVLGMGVNPGEYDDRII